MSASDTKLHAAAKYMSICMPYLVIRELVLASLQFWPRKRCLQRRLADKLMGDEKTFPKETQGYVKTFWQPCIYMNIRKNMNIVPDEAAHRKLLKT
jgi:hypothetical protein